MNSAIGARIVTMGQAGGAQQNLNVGVFERALIALPSLGEQSEICRMIDATYQREDAEDALLEALTVDKEGAHIRSSYGRPSRRTR